MIKFRKKHWQMLLKALLMIGMLVGVSLLSLLILSAFNVVTPFDKFTSIWHWILFVLVCAVFIAFVFFFAYRFNRYMNGKKKASEEAAAKAEADLEVCAEKSADAEEALEAKE